MAEEAQPPLIERPGPWGQSYRDGLDPRWGEEWAYLTNTYGDEIVPYLWMLMRDAFDQGARAQAAKANSLPANPYMSEPPHRQ